MSNEYMSWQMVVWIFFLLDFSVEIRLGTLPLGGYF
jgi:hypothetical protein